MEHAEPLPTTAEAANRRAGRVEDLDQLLVGVQHIAVALGIDGDAADRSQPPASLPAQPEGRHVLALVEPLHAPAEVVADQQVATRRDRQRLRQPQRAGLVAEGGRGGRRRWVLRPGGTSAQGEHGSQSHGQQSAEHAPHRICNVLVPHQGVPWVWSLTAIPRRAGP